MPKAAYFEILAGTYEEYILGYFFSSKEKKLTQSVASHDHYGSVRALAICDKYLASGATDDRIIIYNLKSRKEHCMLTHHESTITALAFTKDHSHIISASQDGSLAIVRAGNWQLEKLWTKAHKGGTILDIAVHSSGKLALSLGTDCTIRTWNLIKGRAAYIINLNSKCEDPKSLEKIIFGPDDVKFILYGGKITQIWSIETGGILEELKHEERVTSCVWMDSNTVFIGYEDGKISVWDLESKTQKISQQGHNGRVKAAQYFEGFITTASSTGQIKVWTRKLREIACVNTDCRITCLSIAQWSGIVKKEEEETHNIDEVVKERIPQKSTVVVEVEYSSDKELSSVKINNTKRKLKGDTAAKTKKNKMENTEQTEQVKVGNKSKNISKKKKKKHNV
ncbi:p21-activated protein kinase-interacting protein 1-like [Sitophilus oryzae]|uniref:P21-activated protein kinase-interacting protein 1-like n=1 Tax=Sitophilus oryzae TaxID=7048 RepID=A0A6J2YAF3_SITOR|nr:p21-activated protein kinase-interacting protein 1-like [Sitophilus oryzae]